jgi:hypothetical protein
LQSATPNSTFHHGKLIKPPQKMRGLDQNVSLVFKVYCNPTILQAVVGHIMTSSVIIQWKEIHSHCLVECTMPNKGEEAIEGLVI